MTEDSGYGPFLTRRGRGNVLTHFITAVNGQSVGSPDQLSSVLARFRPGDTISVTWVSPSGHRRTSSLRLAAGPPQ